MGLGRRQAKRESKQKLRRRQYTADRNLRRTRQKFPQIDVQEGNAPRELVDAVKTAVGKMEWTRLPKNIRTFLKKQRAMGFSRAMQSFEEESEPSTASAAQTIELLGRLGQLLYDPIPETIRRRFLLVPKETKRRPLRIHDVQLLPDARRWRVCFRAMETVRLKGQTLHQSPLKPVVTCGDRTLPLVFSWHAIERSCQRIVAGDHSDYLGMGDAFGIFHDTLDYEVCTLPNGQSAAVLYIECEPACAWTAVLEAMVPDRRRDLFWYWRAGYLPLVASEASFYIAITAQFPGYGNTPEYEAVMASSLSDDEKSTVLAKTKDFGTDELSGQSGKSIVALFHKLGIPQFRGSEASLKARPF